MWINNVYLKNFRNYPELDITLTSGANLFIGKNAQGKSNFLESIELLSLGKSSRQVSDLDLISHNQNSMQAETNFQNDYNLENLKICYEKHSNNKVNKSYFINGKAYKTRKPVLGRLLTVSFKSQDLQLSQNAPKYRRDWLDNLACLISKAYLEIYNNYEKIIAQKNSLLRNNFNSNLVSFNDSLDVYNQQIAQHGAKLIKFRLKTLDRINQYAQITLVNISSANDNLIIDYLRKSNNESSKNNLSYLNSVSQDEFANLLYNDMQTTKALEILRKQSLIGPHRDDLEFIINNQPAKGFASQGQHRSLILALKLAELQLLEDKFSQKPVLLLDDVLAELDENRQAELISRIYQSCQTIITTVNISYLPKNLFKEAFVFDVNNGHITKS